MTDRPAPRTVIARAFTVRYWKGDLHIPTLEEVADHIIAQLDEAGYEITTKEE